MSAFTHGFNIGFASGMFDRMFGGFASVWGGNPFCNCNMNLWSGFNFNFMPVFSMPVMNMSVFNQYPVTSINMPVMPVQNYTMPVFDVMAGWNSSPANFNTGLDTFDYSNKATVNETFNNNNIQISNNFSNFSAPVENTAPNTVTQNVKPAAANTVKQNPRTIKAKTYREMSDADMRNIYGNYTREITTLYNGTAADLNKHLAKRGVLAGKGQAFINAQQKYGISASVLAAICIQETGGTSKNARYKNNVGNISQGKGWRTYNSVEECIDDMARRLKQDYVAQGLNSLYRINAKYCPVQDTRGSFESQSAWAKCVDTITRQLERG